MKKYLKHNGQTYKIELDYSLGGMNYFSGSTELRGIYFHLSPVDVSFYPDGRVRTEMYQAFSGSKRLVKELKRKSDKELARLSIKLTDNNITKLVEMFAAKTLTAQVIDTLFTF